MGCALCVERLLQVDHCGEYELAIFLRERWIGFQLGVHRCERAFDVADFKLFHQERYGMLRVLVLAERCRGEGAGGAWRDFRSRSYDLGCAGVGFLLERSEHDFSELRV